MRMLQPMWSQELEAMADELKALSEYLGDDNDLTVLSQSIDGDFGRDADALELETIKGLIGKRQRQLRASALALGARFYFEKPSAFCDRLAGYWRIWRDG